MFSWLKARKRTANQVKPGESDVVSTSPGSTTLDVLERALDEGNVAQAIETSERLSADQRVGPRYLRLEGWLSYSLGNLDAAEERLKRALQEEPTNAHSHALLAGVHMRCGRKDDALSCAKRAESLGGAYAWLQSLLGTLHYDRGEPERAREHFVRALELDPNRSDALQALAIISYGTQDWDALLEASKRLVSLFPEDPTFWSYLGTAEARAGSDERAKVCFAKAVELPGSTVDNQRDYASFLVNCGHVSEAISLLDVALSKEPKHALLHVAHAQCRLIQEGSNIGAWKEYEWRLRIAESAPNEGPNKWRGERIESGTLHIIGEQGMGDMLLFARLLPEVLKRCTRVLLELPEALVPLFRATADRLAWRGLEVQPSGTSRLDLSTPVRSIPYMSLMNVLGPDVARATDPYLLPDNEREHRWAARLGKKAGHVRVGLVWAGNPKREDDVLRSIPASALAVLADVDGVEFVSLQKDAQAKYLQELPLRLNDVTSEINDFADSAAVLGQCDLLISIDTAAAHLAGACAVPCWVLLPLAKDWRWEMAGVEQPWYAKHRTFRVRRKREWSPVLEAVASQLRRVMDERRPA